MPLVRQEVGGRGAGFRSVGKPSRDDAARPSRVPGFCPTCWVKTRAPVGRAKTANRSVVGSMTKFVHMAEHVTRLTGMTDLVDLSVRLADTPCSPLYDRHTSPDREVAALIGNSRSRRCIAGLKWMPWVSKCRWVLVRVGGVIGVLVGPDSKSVGSAPPFPSGSDKKITPTLSRGCAVGSRLSSKTCTPMVSTPRSVRIRCARSMSGTTECRPFAVPASSASWS